MEPRRGEAGAYALLKHGVVKSSSKGLFRMWNTRYFYVWCNVNKAGQQAPGGIITWSRVQQDGPGPGTAGAASTGMGPGAAAGGDAGAGTAAPIAVTAVRRSPSRVPAGDVAVGRGFGHTAAWEPLCLLLPASHLPPPPPAPSPASHCTLFYDPPFDRW